MTNIIKSNFNEQITILQEQCTKGCQTGALKSIQEFPKEERWYEKNWMSISKPKQESFRETNWQENNMKY